MSIFAAFVLLRVLRLVVQIVEVLGLGFRIIDFWLKSGIILGNS